MAKFIRLPYDIFCTLQVRFTFALADTENDILNTRDAAFPDEVRHSRSVWRPAMGPSTHFWVELTQRLDHSFEPALGPS